MSLKSFILINFLMLHLTCHASLPFTIMIDPAGDAQHAGREINDTFERGLTLQFAQELKNELLKINPNIRVVLTRTPGETIQPLHNALFSNRLQANLYLRFGFFYQEQVPLHLAIFYYCQHATDFLHHYHPLQFYPIHQAYLMNLNVTKHLGQKLNKNLEYHLAPHAFTLDGLFAIPFKPFAGIQAPALYVEAGLRNAQDFKHLVMPIANSICEIMS